MIIQRHYQPDAAISDELVEALYQLLVDGRTARKHLIS